MTTEMTAAVLAFAELHAEVVNFYAVQMQLLDSGEAREWARTFTADGVFAPPSLPEPIRGREALEAAARQAADDLAAAGEVRRHCFLMSAVRPADDATVHATSYTQVVATALGDRPRLHLMCVCEDVLVREAGRLLIRHRKVTADDRPSNS